MSYRQYTRTKKQPNVTPTSLFQAKKQNSFFSDHSTTIKTTDSSLKDSPIIDKRIVDNKTPDIAYTEPTVIPIPINDEPRQKIENNDNLIKQLPVGKIVLKKKKNYFEKSIKPKTNQQIVYYS